MTEIVLTCVATPDSYFYEAGFWSLLGLSAGYAVGRARARRWRKRHFQMYHPDCDHSN